MNGLGVRLRRIFNRRARAGQDVAGDRAHSLANRQFGPQGGLIAHVTDL
jgi:hypothetical protein